MIRLQCSVWTNGKKGWGLKVLGGTRVREAHFRRESSPVYLSIGGREFAFNVDKNSFWTRQCGELIGVALRDWFFQHGLHSGDRVWLEMTEPHKPLRDER